MPIKTKLISFLMLMMLVTALFIPFVSNVEAVGYGYFGYNGAPSGAGETITNIIHFTNFTLSRTAIINNITAKTCSQLGNTDIRFAIYYQSNRTLIASTVQGDATGIAPVGAWVTLAFSSPPTIPAGNYQLAAWGQNAPIGDTPAVLNVTTGTSNQMPYLSLAYGSYPASYTPTGYHSSKGCIYANYSYVTVPDVDTDNASGIGFTNATLWGTLNDDGGGNTSVRFQYGHTLAYGNLTPVMYKTSGQSFSANIISLHMGELYYYRAMATNSNTTVYGTGETLTTNSINMSNPYPITTLTNATSSKINIQLNHTLGLSIRATLWSNITTGSWHQIGGWGNATVGFVCDFNHDHSWNYLDVSYQTSHSGYGPNGTWAYYLNHSQFGPLLHNHTYWWSINVTDGTHWNNQTFSFYNAPGLAGPVISNPNPADASEVPMPDPSGNRSAYWSVNISGGIGVNFNWTIEGACLNPDPLVPPGYPWWSGNTNGTNDTNGIKTTNYGGYQYYNNSFIVWVNVTTVLGATTKEIYCFQVEPNCPPVFNDVSPANNSENNSLAINWEVNMTDDTPFEWFWWEICVYNNATGVLFNTAWSGGYNNTNPIIWLFGLNQSTWYDVYVMVSDYYGGGYGCEECNGTGAGFPFYYPPPNQIRSAHYRFKTINLTGYTGWWNTDWRAKKLISYDVNESEASGLQVLINLTKGTYGATDDFTAYPPRVSVNSSNLGECRFIATYWNISTSTWGYTPLEYFVEEWMTTISGNDTAYYGRDFNLPYSTSSIASINKAGMADRHGNTIKIQDVHWVHIWIKLPPNHDGTKQYNWTSGQIWIYYKNMDYFPEKATSTNCLSLARSSGNNTFLWYRGFNEWMKPSEWTEHTAGGWPAGYGAKWVTQTDTVFGDNGTDTFMGKRLRFVQYNHLFDSTDENLHYHDLFYVGNGATEFPTNSLRTRFSVYSADGATTTSAEVWLQETLNGTAAGHNYRNIPITTTDVNPINTLHFYDLVYLRSDTEWRQFVKIYDALSNYYKRSVWDGSDWGTNYSTFNTIGFHMRMEEAGDWWCSRDWGWTKRYYVNVPSLWQESKDLDYVGNTSEIKCDFPFLFLTKYVPRNASGDDFYIDPPIIFSFVMELPYFKLIYPSDSSTDIPINPMFSGRAMGGYGGILQTEWTYEHDLIPGFQQWAQTNYSLPNTIVSWNGTEWGAPWIQHFDDYRVTYIWGVTVTDTIGNIYTATYIFTTEDIIIANFTFTIIDFDARRVQFNDTSFSTLGIDYYNWLFAHSSTSNKKNPMYTFGSSYNWSVTLTIENETSHRRSSITKYVDLTGATPHEHFLIDIDWGMFIPWMYIIVFIVMLWVTMQFFNRLWRKQR